MTKPSAGEVALLSAVRTFAQNVESGATTRIVERLSKLTVDATADEREAALGVAVPRETAERVARLLSAWRKAPHVTPQSLGWAIAAAEATDEWHRTSTRADLVWTGPLGPGSTFRRTDQALLEVIERAQKQLLIVSFAVYKVEAIQRALVAAVDRGVSIRLVLETSDASGGRYDGDPVASLDSKLTERSEILVWPLEKRPTVKSKSGDPIWGVLHAKCALADDRLLFVSSANLTGAALALNIELGVLVEGGELPSQVGKHFAELIQRQILFNIARTTSRAG
jgi:phosphatidylserine/phosphatidylglycerophosphate/cardiolipin synthase-like enzyme